LKGERLEEERKMALEDLIVTRKEYVED